MKEREGLGLVQGQNPQSGMNSGILSSKGTEYSLAAFQMHD